MRFADAFQRREVSKTFLAMYPGVCDACGFDFAPGDSVLYDDDDLIHEECLD